MALYQPSNIVPSSFAGGGGGTVDVSDLVNISWQVNGNSPMTAFKIDVMANNASSTQIYTTGKQTLQTAFYGVDNKGNVVFYKYSENVTWASHSLANGNAYKLKITQYWQEGGTEKSIEQFSESAFITRAKPIVTVSLPTGNIIDRADYTFTATYSQTQGDSINWVRWRIGKVINPNISLTDSNIEVLDDTGSINTAVLEYNFNGLFNNTRYAISCIVETENGVQSAGTWNGFNVEYTQEEYTGNISANCSSSDNSNIIEWDKLKILAGYSTPTNTSADYSFNSNGVNIPEDNSVYYESTIDNPYSIAEKTEIDGLKINLSYKWDIYAFYERLATENITKIDTSVALLATLQVGKIKLFGTPLVTRPKLLSTITDNTITGEEPFALAKNGKVLFCGNKIYTIDDNFQMTFSRNYFPSGEVLAVKTFDMGSAIGVVISSTYDNGTIEIADININTGGLTTKYTYKLSTLYTERSEWTCDSFEVSKRTDAILDSVDILFFTKYKHTVRIGLNSLISYRRSLERIIYTPLTSTTNYQELGYWVTPMFSPPLDRDTPIAYTVKYNDFIYFPYKNEIYKLDLNNVEEGSPFVNTNIPATNIKLVNNKLIAVNGRSLIAYYPDSLTRYNGVTANININDIALFSNFPTVNYFFIAGDKISGQVSACDIYTLSPFTQYTSLGVVPFTSGNTFNSIKQSKNGKFTLIGGSFAGQSAIVNNGNSTTRPYFVGIIPPHNWDGNSSITDITLSEDGTKVMVTVGNIVSVYNFNEENGELTWVVNIQIVNRDSWETPEVELTDDNLLTTEVDGVTRYKIRDGSTYIGYFDTNGDWHNA